MRRETWERFPRHWFQRKLLVSDPGMYHGTCVTHVPWCMSGSLTCGGGENVPGIPGARATRNIAYLARGPLPGCFLIVSQTLQQTICSEIETKFQHFPFMKNNLKISSANWQSRLSWLQCIYRIQLYDHHSFGWCLGHEMSHSMKQYWSTSLSLYGVSRLFPMTFICTHKPILVTEAPPCRACHYIATLYLIWQIPINGIGWERDIFLWNILMYFSVYYWNYLYYLMTWINTRIVVKYCHW